MRLIWRGVRAEQCAYSRRPPASAALPLPGAAHRQRSPPLFGPQLTTDAAATPSYAYVFNPPDAVNGVPLPPPHSERDMVGFPLPPAEEQC
jgi:hypothetical protein